MTADYVVQDDDVIFVRVTPSAMVAAVVVAVVGIVAVGIGIAGEIVQKQRQEHQEEMEKALGCQIYFADPYCAWQKGTNENLNGLLREFYPKGRNLSHVSSKTLEKNLALINARPKKILGFKKPVDLFFFFLNKCCT